MLQTILINHFCSLLTIQTTDNTACWSFDPSRIGETILNETNIDGAVLTFDALAFEADKSYQITLVATKQERSASATVNIDAVNGNPPKVSVMQSFDSS